MKKLANKIEKSLIRAKVAMNNLLAEERGDTNFLSIAIILVVVLVLAVVFIGFGNRLLPKMREKIEDVFNVLQ